MLIIKDVVISYGKNKIINSLSLHLQNGKIHGLVGLNGAGKTTILNAIYGLKKIDSGTILYNEEKITKKDMAYLETENFFYPGITGREYLSLFENDNFNMDKWNELFHLPLDQMIDSYSTGMKKKLAFLGILKQDKSVMILDEPFNGLDLESCHIIRNVLLRLGDRGRNIVITSHIIETLTNLCDDISYMEKGVIKFRKNKNEFYEFEKEIYRIIQDKSDVLIKELL
jgi:ABC-2 type transport system ATP-binding protein